MKGGSALWYAGIKRDPDVNIVPQPGLDDDEAIATIILPGAKIEGVYATGGADKTPYGTVLAHGINGSITENDRLWCKVLTLKAVLKSGGGKLGVGLLNGTVVVLDLNA